jgi:hypothetical protein
MDCVTAQQLISDALDKSGVDPAALAEAKSHCNECEDCGSFVRAMLAIQRTPAPSPPAGLADRIIEQIRAEANETAYARTRAIAAPGAVAPEVRATLIEPPAATEPRGILSQLTDPRNRRSVLTWAAAAAGIFVLAAWGSVLGVQSILKPVNSVVEYEFTGTEQGSGSAGSADQKSLASPDLSAVQPTGETPRFMTASGGLTFRVGSAAGDIAKDTLTEAGQTGTRLDKRSARGSVIYSGPGGAFYIEGEDGGLLILEAMSFGYGGQTYELVSEPIEDLGMWPSLPSGIKTPRREDGSPTFTQAVPDKPDGVFILKGLTASEGIALPPKTQLVQPLSQCPNWTFWRLRK